MKRFNLSTLAVIGFAAIVGLSSCGEDETATPKPTVTLTAPTSESVTLSAGSSITITFEAASENELSKVTIAKGGTNLLDSTIAKNTKSITISKTYTVGASGTETYAITATDKENQVTTKTVTVTINTSAQINAYSAKLLGGQSNSTSGSFFKSTTGDVLSQADAKAASASVDFLYFFGSSNAATIAAPADADAQTIYNNSNTGIQTWATKNNTGFYASNLTSADFDALNSTAALDALTTGSASTKSNQLANGQVFGFKTAAGKSGAVRVGTVSGTQSGSITIDVKVSK